MKLAQISFTNLLNYIPGLIILVFSMLALHSSLRMMDVYQEVLLLHKEESRDVLLLEKTFYDLESVAVSFLNNPHAENQRIAERRLKAFADVYFKKLEGLQNHPKKNIPKEYLKNLTEIKADLMNVSQFILYMENVKDAGGSSADSELLGHLKAVHKKIEGMAAVLYSDEVAQDVYNSIGRRDGWLYWSVIAVGLSGFVLVILNTDKLRKLRIINKERQQTLALLENRLAAMEAASDGIGIVDRNGNLTYMNHALMDLHGIELEKMADHIGQKWENLYMREAYKEVTKKALADLSEEGYWLGEIPVVRQDGEVVSAELSLTRLPDGGFIGAARDITEKQKARKEKEELQSQFFQAQKMEAIGRLAGGIAHDFNNILAAMNGYAEFLIEDLKEGGPQHKFAENILQAGRQARTLVDQMLAFSRRTEDVSDHIDLVVPLNEALAMLKASLPKTIEVQTDIDIESAPIHGNATQISQLIMNLCVNAKDAMNDGHGELSIKLKAVAAADYAAELGILSEELPDAGETPMVRVEDIQEDRTRLVLSSMARGHRYACLSIQDTGCGMSRVIMEHIFEPFFTTKPVNKGTGLGLSTIHGVITTHRGAMIVDSMLNKGTLFEVLFPMVDEEALTDGAAIEEIKFDGGGDVLLVEDQEEVRDMMTTMLERLGYEVVACVNGLEAMDALRESPDGFDLVITDQNMPKMTGLELVSQAHLDFPDLPFILLSGYSQQKLQDLMQEHPAIKSVLRKPVSRQILSREIQNVIVSYKGTRAVA